MFRRTQDDFINGDGPKSARASNGVAKLKDVNLDMTRRWQDCYLRSVLNFHKQLSTEALHKVISVYSVSRVAETGSQAAALQNDLALEKERRKSLEKQVS